MNQKAWIISQKSVPVVHMNLEPSGVPSKETTEYIICQGGRPGAFRSKDSVPGIG